MPMYAESETTSLEFKNLCGVLKITVNNTHLASVKSITVSSTNKAVSGAFTVSGDAAVLTDASNTAKTVTVTYTEAVTTGGTGKVFYVAIPAQTYQELKIELDADGNGFTKSMTTKSATNITVERNKIYPITFADNSAPATTGTAKRTGDIDVRWVQLWAGGPKFAEYNVGAANNKAEDYGGYYAWGGYQDKVDDHNTTNDGSEDLSSTDDTATNLWGSNWRMPKKIDLENLLVAANCTVEWTTVNSVSGRKFTGKDDYASNSIFLPAAGYCFGGGVLGQGGGYYWSSTPRGSTAYYLYFSSGYQDVGDDNRSVGCSVRAVLKED